MSETAQLIADLVGIESINPDLDVAGSGEAAIAEFVAGWLRDGGIEVELQESAPGRPNVIGIVRGSGGGRSLMLNAHMDTVSAGQMDGPFEPRFENGRVYGRGAYDMKGALAAIMLTARDLVGARLAGDVIITAVTDEEYASAGTEAVVRSYKADACIITEPTDLELCLAHKGFAWATIETSGVAAHGSLCMVGVDAIAKMGPVLTALGELDRSLQAGRRHDLVGTASVHASLIDGGTELSTYPDRCRLQIERRTIPGESDADVVRQLEEVAAAGGASLRIGLVRYPYDVEPDAELARSFQAVAGKVLGAEPVISGGTAWMDSALTGGAGIPTIIFGPSGDGAHADMEWVDVASVDQCRTIYGRFAKEWCK
jgi:acetylornithine deacetylase